MPQPVDANLYSKIRNKVKASVKRWPSAYASGMVVKLYKKAMEERGIPPYTTAKARSNDKKGLTRWFDERWVDVSDITRPCGSTRTSGYYPTCRPLKIAKAMTQLQRMEMIALKQKAKSKVAARKWSTLLSPI